MAPRLCAMSLLDVRRLSWGLVGPYYSGAPVSPLLPFQSLPLQQECASLCRALLPRSGPAADSASAISLNTTGEGALAAAAVRVAKANVDQVNNYVAAYHRAHGSAFGGPAQALGPVPDGAPAGASIYDIMAALRDRVLAALGAADASRETPHFTADAFAALTQARHQLHYVLTACVRAWTTFDEGAMVRGASLLCGALVAAVAALCIALAAARTTAPPASPAPTASKQPAAESLTHQLSGALAAALPRAMGGSLAGGTAVAGIVWLAAREGPRFVAQHHLPASSGVGWIVAAAVRAGTGANVLGMFGEAALAIFAWRLGRAAVCALSAAGRDRGQHSPPGPEEEAVATSSRYERAVASVRSGEAAGPSGVFALPSVGDRVAGMLSLRRRKKAKEGRACSAPTFAAVVAAAAVLMHAASLMSNRSLTPLRSTRHRKFLCWHPLCTRKSRTVGTVVVVHRSAFENSDLHPQEKGQHTFTPPKTSQNEPQTAKPST